MHVTPQVLHINGGQGRKGKGDTAKASTHHIKKERRNHVLIPVLKKTKKIL